MKPRVFLTRKIPQAGLEPLEASCDLHLWDAPTPVPREVLLREAAEAEGLLTLLSDPIDEEVLDTATRLRVISQYAVGYDNIDVAAATARGIPVGHTPDVLTEATADMAFALLMATARRLVEGVDNVRGDAWHTWGPEILLGYDVWGKTLGIIGMGRIGQAMARRGRGFDMDILYAGPHPKPEIEVELKANYVAQAELLARSDFVSLHCPLNDATHHLVDSEALQAMQCHAILINTARGGIVDTEALIRALQAGWIAAAALDVTDPEPIPADHPLLSLPQCVITPHIGSASITARTQMAKIAARNLLAGLRGEPLPYCVNPKPLSPN